MKKKKKQILPKDLKNEPSATVIPTDVTGETAKVIVPTATKKVTTPSTPKVTLKSVVQKDLMELLKKSKSGEKYGDIVTTIQKKNPGFKIKSIHGCIWNLMQKEEFKTQMKKSKGVYSLSK